MTLTDGLTVLGVFAGIGYMIWAKLESKNSGITQKTREWFRKRKMGKAIGLDTERSQQIYTEKRQIM